MVPVRFAALSVANTPAWLPDDGREQGTLVLCVICLYGASEFVYVPWPGRSLIGGASVNILDYRHVKETYCLIDVTQLQVRESSRIQ